MTQPISPNDPDDRILSLRVADADRDRISEILSRAYTMGRLTRAEFDDRLTAVLTAKTFADIRPLVDDLLPDEKLSQVLRPSDMPLSGSLVERQDSSAALVPVDSSIETPPIRSVAFFSDATKSPARLSQDSMFFSCLSTTVVDLTEAVFESQTCKLNLFAFLGDIIVFIPAGVNVHVDSGALLGEVEQNQFPHYPGAPNLIIMASPLIGKITICDKNHRKFQKYLTKKQRKYRWREDK